MADEQTPKSYNPTVRAIVDYGGPAVWLIAFSAYRVLGHKDALLEATWWLVGGSVVALLIGYIAERRIAPIPLFAALVAVVFGSLALIFQNKHFLYYKPTIINVVLGVLMLGGTALGKNPLKALFSGSLNLTPGGWRKLTIRYGVFFLAMAALNEAVWRTQPEAVWVFFKFPGMVILTVLFAAAQTPMMMKDMKAMEAAAELEI